jgi:hypothetical protein
MILRRAEDETVEELFEKKSDEIHTFIANKVCDALDSGVNFLVLFTIMPDDLEMHCRKEDFLDTLITNLPYIEKLEDYELCTRVHEWISKLKIENYES